MYQNETRTSILLEVTDTFCQWEFFLMIYDDSQLNVLEAQLTFERELILDWDEEMYYSDLCLREIECSQCDVSGDQQTSG